MWLLSQSQQAWDLMATHFNVFLEPFLMFLIEIHMRKTVFCLCMLWLCAERIRQACRTRSAGHQTVETVMVKWFWITYVALVNSCWIYFGRICTIICTILQAQWKCNICNRIHDRSHMTWVAAWSPISSSFITPSNLFCHFGMPCGQYSQLPFVLGSYIVYLCPRCSGGFTWLVSMFIPLLPCTSFWPLCRAPIHSKLTRY